MVDLVYIQKENIVLNIESLLTDYSKSIIGVIDYAKVSVKFSTRSEPLDIGSWCFIRRRRAEKGKRLVDQSSLRAERATLIENLLSSIVFELDSGKRENSLLQELKAFEQFLEWCDSSGREEDLNSLDKARKLIIEYISSLRDELRAMRISNITAVAKQNYASKWLALGLDVDRTDLVQGINILRKDMRTVRSTISPLNNEAAYQIKCYDMILRQLSDLLTESKKLPFLLNLPGYSIWIMPQKKVFATVEMLDNRAFWKNAYRAYDYQNGRINSPGEIVHFYSGYGSIEGATEAVRRALSLTKRVNSDPHHFIRIFIFNYAQAAFYNLFLANTGMNSKQAFELDWSSEFSLDKTYQGFKTVKYRARGKSQEFMISSSFISTFKLFLKLRSFILKGEEYTKLFISHHNGSVIHQTLRRDYLAKITRTQLGPLIGCKPITPREWRSYKSVKVLEQSDGNLEIASELLQNTPSTIRKSYGNNNEKSASSEFYDFFGRLLSRTENKIESTPSGGCVNLDQPSSSHSSIKPNCKSFEYCLFCDNYAIHGDENDIRKLLSMKYIILETRHLSSSYDHFSNTYSEILFRIEHIVEATAREINMDPDELQYIRDDISNENISDYWQSKLNLLQEIGALG